MSIFDILTGGSGTAAQGYGQSQYRNTGRAASSSPGTGQLLGAGALGAVLGKNVSTKNMALLGIGAVAWNFYKKWSQQKQEEQAQTQQPYGQQGYDRQPSSMGQPQGQPFGYDQFRQGGGQPMGRPQPGRGQQPPMVQPRDQGMYGQQPPMGQPRNQGMYGQQPPMSQPRGQGMCGRGQYGQQGGFGQPAVGGQGRDGFGQQYGQQYARQPGQNTQTVRAQAAPLDATAELVMRAMVYAARADGTIDSTEQGRITTILQQMLPEQDVTGILSHMQQESIDPNRIAALVRGASQGEDVYRFSCVVIDIDHFMERSYLDALAQSLAISSSRQKELEQEATVARGQFSALVPVSDA